MSFTGSVDMAGIRPTPRLHKFNASFIDKDFSGTPAGQHDNELFFNCTFDDVRNATFKNCTMNNSKLLVNRLEDALGLTATLDCKSFHGLELSPLLFDLMVVLLLKTKGNVEKRKKLLEVLGKERVVELLHQLEEIE